MQKTIRFSSSRRVSSRNSGGTGATPAGWAAAGMAASATAPAAIAAPASTSLRIGIWVVMDTATGFKTGDNGPEGPLSKSQMLRLLRRQLEHEDRVRVAGPDFRGGTEMGAHDQGQARGH